MSITKTSAISDLGSADGKKFVPALGTSVTRQVGHRRPGRLLALPRSLRLPPPLLFDFRTFFSSF